MDTALLTTVEQLSDDGPGNRGAPWPTGSTVATSLLSGQPGLNSAVQDEGRDGQNGAVALGERYVAALTSLPLSLPMTLPALLLLFPLISFTWALQLAWCTSNSASLAVRGPRSCMARSCARKAAGLVIIISVPAPK